jgi:hypothetical protein
VSSFLSEFHDSFYHRLDIRACQLAVSVATLSVVGEYKNTPSQSIGINLIDKPNAHSRIVDQTFVVNVCNVLTIGKAHTGKATAINHALDIFEPVNLNS